MKKHETCQNQNPNLPASYLRQQGITFAELYRSPENLAQHTLAMRPVDRSVVNLPLDCCLEAELLGATITGYTRSDVLRAMPMAYHQTLPVMNLEHWRLQNILQALEQINTESQTACLNFSGFAAVFDAVYGSGLFYSEWLRQRFYVTEFISLLQNNYLRMIEMALARNIRLFSFAEPTLLLSLIGKTFAAEYSEQALIPFLRKIRSLKEPLVFHICRLTTAVLRKSEKICLRPVTFPEASSSDDILRHLCRVDKSPIIIGNNCINYNQTIKYLDEICWSDSRQTK